MTFLKRKIDLTFRLGKNTEGNRFQFAGTDYTEVKVTGHRVQVNIANAGGVSMGTATIRVFGLTPSVMNDLAQVMRLSEDAIVLRWNQVVVEAGDDVNGMSQIFQGQINLAPINMNSAPETDILFSAVAGLYEAVKQLPPSSYPKSADAAVIMQNLAAESDPPLNFENNGVSVILATPYFQGSLRDQMKRCAEAANINWTVDNSTLVIWPKGGFRETSPIPLISPTTGMVGYPTNYQLGVAVKTLFNPSLQNGKICQVQSSLPFANGKFIMFEIGHDLESEMPGGSWFTNFKGSPFNVS